MNLAESCGKFFEKFYDFTDRDKNCLVRTLELFCKSGKKEDAFSVYFSFCEIYNLLGKGYSGAQKLLELLADHEYHSGGLLEKHRDHYSHSVYVFALGLAFFAADEKLQKTFGKPSDFIYLWGLTSLFHDIGYPFQLAHEQIKNYTRDLFGERADNPHVVYSNTDSFLHAGKGCRIAGEEKIFYDINELLAFGVCQRTGYDFSTVKDVFSRKVTASKFMDHAYFSAVLLFKQIEERGSINSDKLDVLTAIALHNSFNKFDMPDAVRLSLQNHPYAYLLMLCDELQNWDRTAFGHSSKKDPLAWDIDLELGDGVINITYIFDSFNIEIPGRNASRQNRNVSKLFPEGRPEFVSEILRYVDPHAETGVKAVEKPKDKQLHKYTSADNFVNIYNFAKVIHNSYREIYGGETFEELDLEFKLSNIEQAKSYSYKLELINCFYSDRELDYPVLKEFTSGTGEEELREQKDDLGFLAREEHLRWVREKLQAGWRYGTSYIDPENGTEDRKKRNLLKEHRDIVPYDVLSETERKKDELMIKNMIPLLYEQGNCIRIYRYRLGRKPDLEIATIGHRLMRGDTEKIKNMVKDILARYQKEYRVIVRSKFAYGADLLIAECAAELGITLKAVLPLDYEEHIAYMRNEAKENKIAFGEAEELRMRHLLAQTVRCTTKKDPVYFLAEANKYMINKCTKLIAVWDGIETLEKDGSGRIFNPGGTYHCIQVAKARGFSEKDIHIVPCERY